MIKLEFKINSLPSLNEYINLERSNKFAAASLKKKLTNLVQLMALNQIRIQYPNFTFPIENRQNAFFVWETENNKQDSDNIFFAKKFIFDGLIKANILGNDGRKQINHCFDFIKTTGRKAVTIYLVDSIDLDLNITLFQNLLYNQI